MYCWRRLLRVPWTVRRSNQSVLKEYPQVLNIHWKDWCWSWSSNTLATWCAELTHLKRPWCWERLVAGGEGDDKGWDGWMASPTQWTWVWVDFGSWWWTGKPGVLWFTGSQRVRDNWTTELKSVETQILFVFVSFISLVLVVFHFPYSLCFWLVVFGHQFERSYFLLPSETWSVPTWQVF